MTATTAPLTLITPDREPHQWWQQQPTHVRAVLDLAWHRDTDMHPDVHDRILTLVAPDHADRVVEIAEWLHLADDLECGRRDWEHSSDTAAMAEMDRLRGDAVVSAQLVASLLTAGRTS